jgi:hypothetical protein
MSPLNVRLGDQSQDSLLTTDQAASLLGANTTVGQAWASGSSAAQTTALADTLLLFDAIPWRGTRCLESQPHGLPTNEINGVRWLVAAPVAGQGPTAIGSQLIFLLAPGAADNPNFSAIVGGSLAWVMTIDPTPDYRQVRTVTDYDRVTGQFTIDAPFPDFPDGKTMIFIFPPPLDIRRAYALKAASLLLKGHRPDAARRQAWGFNAAQDGPGMAGIMKDVGWKAMFGDVPEAIRMIEPYTETWGFGRIARG